MNSLSTDILSSARILEAMASDSELLAGLQQVIDLCVASLRTGGKIMFMGNGGSAADAQHLAGELVSRFEYDRPGLASIALTTDTSVLTAIGNDYGYEKLFSRQVQALGRAGDVLIGISTSGNSPNVVNALTVAKSSGIHAIGLTGNKPCKMTEICNLVLRAPSSHTPLIQQCHITLGHILCREIERELFPNT